MQTLKEVNSITLDRPLQGMQLSPDKSVLAIACGKKALFYDTQRCVFLCLLKTEEVFFFCVGVR